MASAKVVSQQPDPPPPLITFEELLKCAPVCESLLLQLPTDSILALYHTCRSLRQFLRAYPTSWKYLSYRLYQINAPTTIQQNSAARQSSNYAIDQLLIYVVNPFSTCLTSLELDNTAVSGLVLSQTVLALRRETLEHLSVRGCKNVSLKYHINPWLNVFGLVQDLDGGARAPTEYKNLALKSLYTYRCRHHRRRPYLPASLQRKDSDSEPTHELVNLCHRLGIWTDTAWCTTPGGRCFRRRGYSTMRGPQDHREVWVVFDRLWRSRNWLGSSGQTPPASNAFNRKRKRDCRSWECEEAARGEALGPGAEGKGVPAHLRRTHTQYVDSVWCDSCSNLILERCEQCSVIMHCTGCRKTLCGSCAFDRPYNRNANAAEEDRNKFWWAPGCAVSPCSMQDHDPTPGPAQDLTANGSTILANLKFKWCCVEPVFSGGGGITFSPVSQNLDTIRAAPTKRGMGWEDPDFSPETTPTTQASNGPGGRWKSIDGFFRRDDFAETEQTAWTSQTAWAVPRNLCDECYSVEQWKVRCKACTTPICLKHDLRDRLRARLCGYKDLSIEKTEFRIRQKEERKAARGKAPAVLQWDPPRTTTASALSKSRVHNLQQESAASVSTPIPGPLPATPPRPIAWLSTDDRSPTAPESAASTTLSALTDDSSAGRAISPESNGTATPSRSSSPTPSITSSIGTVGSGDAMPGGHTVPDLPPNWRGCQSFLCPPSRVPGDHRRRCLAVVRQCLDCKVNVCGDCVATMDAGCPCTECRAPVGDEGSSASGDGIRFFCPNCRWKRRQTGACKRRNAGVKRAAGRKEKHRKPFKDRVSASRNQTSSSYDDSAVEMLSEFMESLTMERVDEGSEPHGVGLVQGQERYASIDDTMQDIQELEDMGALARDLITRIQGLRAQMRPRMPPTEVIASESMPGSALPVPEITMVLADRETEEINPVVEEMD